MVTLVITGGIASFLITWCSSLQNSLYENNIPLSRLLRIYRAREECWRILAGSVLEQWLADVFVSTLRRNQLLPPWITLRLTYKSASVFFPSFNCADINLLYECRVATQVTQLLPPMDAIELSVF